MFILENGDIAYNALMTKYFCFIRRITLQVHFKIYINGHVRGTGHTNEVSVITISLKEYDSKWKYQNESTSFILIISSGTHFCGIIDFDSPVVHSPFLRMPNFHAYL